MVGIKLLNGKMFDKMSLHFNKWIRFLKRRFHRKISFILNSLLGQIGYEYKLPMSMEYTIGFPPFTIGLFLQKFDCDDYPLIVILRFLDYIFNDYIIASIDDLFIFMFIIVSIQELCVYNFEFLFDAEIITCHFLDNQSFLINVDEIYKNKDFALNYIYIDKILSMFCKKLK